MAEANNNLRELFVKIAKENGYENARVDVQDISSEGANYASTLHVATISAPPKKDLKLFAKVACIGEAIRTTDETVTKAFDTERVFYSELAVAFGKLYDKHDVPMKDRIYIPKYYGHQSAENKETIVLENLVSSGFENFDRFKPFDWDYASAAVGELAKFHALTMTAAEENLRELKSIKTIGLDIFDVPNMKEVFAQQAIKMGTEYVEEEYKGRLQNYLKEQKLIDDLAKLWKTSDEGFLIHSDYKPNNLMHRRQNGKVQVVPLDFQTLHFGSLVADLLYFVWSGSDSKFRQNHYQQLLEYYYSELTIALNNLHININEIYPRKTFEQELENCKTLGLFFGLGLMAIWTVDPENAPKLDTMDSLAIEPNQLALDKMNDVVRDYVRWGII